MTAAPGFFHVESPYVTRNLKDRLLKAAAELSDNIADGVADTYDSYRFLVGKRQGLLEAVDILDELEKQERN